MIHLPNTLTGKRIRTRRLQLGLTQEQLAEKADISISFLGHIERGTRVASLMTMTRICMALGVSLDWLIGLNDSINIPNGYSEKQVEQAKELLLYALRLADK